MKKIEEYRFTKERKASPWSFFRGADFSLGNVPAQLVCLWEDVFGCDGSRFNHRGPRSSFGGCALSIVNYLRFPPTQKTPVSGKQAVGSEM